MSITEKKNRKRKLEQLKAFISEETSLLHLNRAVRPLVKNDLIPISYNFLYLLLLFRTKERPYIEKAMQELNHLLYFQLQTGESKGNFPVYLHQYPACERQFEMLNCLVPLYWIAKDFSHILDKKLKKKLTDALKLGLKAFQLKQQEQTYSYSLNLQMAALELSIGSFLEDPFLVEKGAESLNDLAKQEGQECWGSPRSLSKMLIALHLIENLDLLKPWKPFFSFLKSAWHPETKSYVGPALSEYYEGDTSEKNLYHFFMEKTDESEPHLGYSPIVQLEGELLATPFIKLEGTIQRNQAIGPYSWQSAHFETYTWSIFNLTTAPWIKTGGYYPFKLHFANEQGYDDFVLQMGTPASIEQINERKLRFTFNPPEDEELDVAFFWKRSSQAEVFVDDTKASTFQLHQKVEFKFQNHAFSLIFPNTSLPIWGQLMKKNRRTQLLEGEENILDSHLYFRQIDQLKEPFQIELEML